MRKVQSIVIGYVRLGRLWTRTIKHAVIIYPKRPVCYRCIRETFEGREIGIQGNCHQYGIGRNDTCGHRLGLDSIKQACIRPVRKVKYYVRDGDKHCCTAIGVCIAEAACIIRTRHFCPVISSKDEVTVKLSV